MLPTLSRYQALQVVECAEPDVGRLLRKMVSVQPADRPSTTQLIKAFKQLRALQGFTQASRVCLQPYTHHQYDVHIRKSILTWRMVPYMHTVFCCCRTNLKWAIVLFWAVATVPSNIQVQEAQIQKGPALKHTQKPMQTADRQIYCGMVALRCDVVF